MAQLFCWQGTGEMGHGEEALPFSLKRGSTSSLEMQGGLAWGRGPAFRVEAPLGIRLHANTGTCTRCGSLMILVESTQLA